MPGLPPITIIVPVGKHGGGLGDLIEALLSLHYPDFEVIFAYESDMGTDDLSRKARLDQRIRRVITSHDNPSGLRNVGVLHSRHDLLAFVDSDCLPKRDWLRQLVIARSALGVKVVVGTTLSSNCHRSGWARVAAERYALWFKGAQSDGLMTRVDTKNMMMEKELLLSLGLFDENLVSKEDRDLTLRILRSGEKIGLAPSAVVYHRDPETMGDVYRRAVWYSRGMRQFRNKHRAGLLSDRAEVMFYKRYVGESILTMIAIPWLMTTGILSAMGLLKGYLLVIVVLAGLIFLAAAFKSLIRVSAKFILRRSRREDFFFDLVSDLGHKIGYISDTLTDWLVPRGKRAVKHSRPNGMQDNR